LPAIWTAIKGQQGQKGSRRFEGTAKGQPKGRSPQGRGKGQSMWTSGAALVQVETEFQGAHLPGAAAARADYVSRLMVHPFGAAAISADL
ncbi:unnamed protein product, partial [Symbiodinium sp. KB8]